MTPYFSIIVPFHNAEGNDRSGMLDALLASIPDRDDLEVILVDDHSRITPRWHPRGAGFSQTRIRLLHAPPTSRYGGMARNHGLDHADGTHILFADSDDLFDPDALSAVLDAVVADVVAEHEGNDAPTDLWLFRSGSFRPDGSDGTRHHHTEGLINTLLLSGDGDALVRYRSPCGKIIRAEFIAANNLRFSSHRVVDDVLFGTALALAQPRWNVVDRVAYHIREGHPSLTTMICGQAISERFSVARAAHDLLVEAGRRDLATSLHHKARQYFRSNPTAVTYEMIKSFLLGYPVLPRARALFRMRPGGK